MSDIDEITILKQELENTNELCQEYVVQIANLNTQINIVQEELIEANEQIEDMQCKIDKYVLKFDKRICKHITFFYTEKSKDERLGYINRIIDEVHKYRYTTDVFIHTNVDFSKDLLHKNMNGYMYIIVHDLTGENPFKLAWKCRDLLKKQRDEYDIFMYVEDDILVYNDALEYWFENKDKLLRNGFNLGFTRIEIDENGVEYASDFIEKLGNFLVEIEGTLYLINNRFPYCAFWVYDKSELNKWINTELFNPENILGYDIREQSAVGLHGLCSYWYKTTVFPYINHNLHSKCKIHHMSNSYLHNVDMPNAKIPFQTCIHFG